MTTRNSPTQALVAQAQRIVDELKAMPKPRAKPAVKFGIAMDGTDGLALNIKTVEWTWDYIDSTPRLDLIARIVEIMRV
jgi:hypothetical protein